MIERFQTPALLRALAQFPVVALLGPRQVGKTTLARMFQKEIGAQLVLEVFEENPFLTDFYTDRARYAFQTQIFFLLSRYQQQRHGVQSLLTTDSALISDYTFEKDSLFARVNLAGDELEMYYRVHEALGEKITHPDLILYLRASTPVLMQRIARRDRSYERQMEWGYIDTLNREYDRFFVTSGDAKAPVLTIDTDTLDYVQNPADLAVVENRIRQALNLAPFQPDLFTPPPAAA